MKYYLIISVVNAKLEVFGHIANMKMTGNNELISSAWRNFAYDNEIEETFFTHSSTFMHCLQAAIAL